MKYYVNRDNVNDDFVMVRSIYVQTNQAVDIGDKVLEYETSKTVVELLAESVGRVALFVEVGEEVAVGDLLFEIADTLSATLSSNKITLQDDRADEGKLIQIFSNAAKEYAIQNKVNLEKLEFKNKWVVKRDLERYLAPSDDRVDLFSTNDRGGRSDEKIGGRPDSLHSLRKRAEIKNLKLGNDYSLNSTIGIEVPILGPRNAAVPFIFENNISDVLIYEASRLLVKYPELNSYAKGIDGLCLYQNVNFGVSFDSGSNLKVLSINNSHKKNLTQIQNEFESLLLLYESNCPIDLDILTGSTITLSDLSNLDISYMLPLLNGNQSMIIGMTRNNDSGFRIYATFDHRAAEGYRVSHFLLDLRERVQSHFAMKHTCHFCKKSFFNERTQEEKGLLSISIAPSRTVLICKKCYLEE